MAPSWHKSHRNVAFTSARQLGGHLARSETRLLVLPFGSAFPEESWDPILAFLEQGGNLLVLSVAHSRRAAYRTRNDWRLREYNVRFSRCLMIDQYEMTPGREGMSFETNPDIPLKLPQFTWNRGFTTQ